MEKKNIPTEKTMDKMEQILKKIEDERTVTLEELRTAGFILVVDKDFGRMINRPHLKKLKQPEKVRLYRTRFHILWSGIF